MAVVPEFEHSQEIDAPPDAVWRLVSDPNRLANWVPTATASRPAGADEVHLRGESHGHDYNTSGGFVTDAAARRLSWDSPRRSGYGGTLLVAGHGGGSQVTVRVTIPDAPAEADAEITRGLRETVDRIASLTKE
jgi:uncharacterized protein YndB with AHSA1/START domain